MSTLSDLLGIPHFTTARGSTVRRDFLEAVAVRLGVVPGGTDKDGLIRLVWEAAQGRPMPDDRWSVGGTVTNLVLQEILDGVLSGRVTGIAPAPARGEESQVAAGSSAAVEEFDPAGFADERTRRLIEVAQREGQDSFRTKVLEAYGVACAVTATRVPSVLQAAHIAPYRGVAFNVVPNGLCLRADVHVLFDRGAIAIHERTMRLLVKPHLRDSPYWDLQDQEVARPRSVADRPSVPALRGHRLWAGFTQ